MTTQHLEDEVDPWAMQIIARVPRADPPTATQLCEVVAFAVTCHLDAARDPMSPAHEAVVSWLDGRIRKLVRRARAGAWDAVQGEPGLTIERHGLCVRVLDPTPKSRVPAVVARLQVEGLRLEDPFVTRDRLDPHDAVVVYLNPEWGLDQHPGKAAAQVAHAAQLSLDDMDEFRRTRYFAAGEPVRVVWPDHELWRRLRPDAPVVIRDAGFTVLPRPGETALAVF